MGENLACPHCSATFSMDESERYCRHTTYWGERGPRRDECPKCEREIFIKENVTRWWTIGKTPEEPRP